MRKYENTVLLEVGDSLYRYNLGGDLPENWDTAYHSIEYVYPQYGPKNSIGAIFLYENEITAKQVLAAALLKQQKDGKRIEQVSITTTQARENIQLLDLETGLNNCSNIISVLNDLEIDVLTDGFFNYNKRLTFSTIREYLDNLYSMEPSNRLNAANKINDFFCNYPPYLCQLLTDFENGATFKSLLQAKGYEGYVFMEQFRSNTYCIFGHEKLSQPTHKVFNPMDDIELLELMSSIR